MTTRRGRAPCPTLSDIRQCRSPPRGRRDVGTAVVGGRGDVVVALLVAERVSLCYILLHVGVVTASRTHHLRAVSSCASVDTVECADCVAVRRRRAPQCGSCLARGELLWVLRRMPTNVCAQAVSPVKGDRL